MNATAHKKFCEELHEILRNFPKDDELTLALRYFPYGKATVKEKARIMNLALQWKSDEEYMNKALPKVQLPERPFAIYTAKEKKKIEIQEGLRAVSRRGLSIKRRKFIEAHEKDKRVLDAIWKVYRRVHNDCINYITNN